MQDYREELLRDVRRSMISNGMDTDVIINVERILISKLVNYEFTERCTDVVLYEDQSEKLIEYFIGTLMIEGKSKKTAYVYKRELEKLWAFVGKPLDAISMIEIKNYLAVRLRTATPRTCSSYRSYISSFYAFLYREKIIKENIMENIRPIKFNRKKKKYFTDTQIEQLRTVCPNLRDRAIIEVLLSSGIRAAELSALDINDVNFETKEVIIRHGKGDKERIVYISDTCVFHLQRYLSSRTDNKPALFPSRVSDRLAVRSIEDRLKFIGGLANIENVHPHRFRVHFASVMYKKGMDIRTIQQLLGHESIGITNGYIADIDGRTRAEYARAA